MPKTLADLRDHLFDTLERLKADKDPMDIERARAVAEVSKTILDSAKVEIGYIRATGAAAESEFIRVIPIAKAIPQNTAANASANLECIDCGQKFDQAGMEEHKRRVRQTGKHSKPPVIEVKAGTE